jgi:hypothetical protein
MHVNCEKEVMHLVETGKVVGASTYTRIKITGK